jgi:hypothetical protein
MGINDLNAMVYFWQGESKILRLPINLLATKDFSTWYASAKAQGIYTKMTLEYMDPDRNRIIKTFELQTVPEAI